MLSWLGSLSRFINRLCGGYEHESLCGRWARTRGPYSRICRAIDFILGDGHCWDERIHTIKKRAGK